MGLCVFGGLPFVAIQRKPRRTPTIIVGRFALLPQAGVPSFSTSDMISASTTSRVNLPKGLRVMSQREPWLDGLRTP